MRKKNKAAPAKALYQRHAALVDKKFSRGLSTAEKRELAKINRQLDSAEDGYYEPIKDDLRRVSSALEPQHLNGRAGEFYQENCNNPRRAELLSPLDAKTWQARNLATDAKIRIRDKHLHQVKYSDGWSRITAQEALGEDWGKVVVNAEAEEMFQMFGRLEQ